LLLALSQLSEDLYAVKSAADTPNEPIKVDPPGSMLRLHDPESVVLSDEVAPFKLILQYACHVPATAPVLSTFPVRVIGHPGWATRVPFGPTVMDPVTSQPVWVKVTGKSMTPATVLSHGVGLSEVAG
jgi:hypothetical protein